MKKKLFILLIALTLIVSCALACTACNKVAPGAWVTLKNEGYTIYTSHAYPSGGYQIIFYENEADAEGDTHVTNAAICINFYPGILGADTRGDIRTTIVDIGKKYCEMHVYVYKDKATYSTEKKFYLNGVELVPSNTYDCEYFISWTYENFSPKRGNPGGHLNDIINEIEYK